MQVTKNISKGREIKDFAELYSLSIKKESVVAFMGGQWFVRPAAFMIHWSVAQLLRTKLYYAEKK